MIILIDSEKVFDKIQHPFMIKKKKKTSPESGHTENLPHHNKATYNIILKGEKLKTFPLKPPDVYSCHFYSTVLEILVTAIRKGKEIKEIQTGTRM